MDQKTLALIATLLLASTLLINTETNMEFEQFKLTHGRQYENAEVESYRLAVFLSNKASIDAHNADPSQTYTQGINQFTDLTKAEFKAIYLGYKPKANVAEALDDADYENAGDINWVTKGGVQVVKDQGQCGSCWAFSTVAGCEGASFVSTGTLGDFSEQQLVSCDTVDSGCNGGLMDNGFNYFISNGICTESSYPYTSGGGSVASCKQSSCTKSSFTISSYKDVSGTSALQSACDQQPVSIAVDAENWSPYTGGIFSNCGTSLDHGVLLAGYTSSYWLVKNSWAASWGESGYIRLASGNTCGLANQPSYPIH